MKIEFKFNGRTSSVVLCPEGPREKAMLAQFRQDAADGSLKISSGSRENPEDLTFVVEMQPPTLIGAAVKLPLASTDVRFHPTALSSFSATLEPPGGKS